MLKICNKDTERTSTQKLRNEVTARLAYLLSILGNLGANLVLKTDYPC